MIKIGTRTLISIDGKPILATHWDGYPSCLGLELLNCDKTLPAIIKVAKGHTIDAADHKILQDLNRQRIEKLSEKHRLSMREIKAGKRRGFIICAKDYEICSIKNYGDWAKYQYDVRYQEIYFRPLGGFYPKSVENAALFRRLTQSLAKKD